MVIKQLTAVLSALCLTGCVSYYDWGVRRDGSPIPYENSYTSDDDRPFENYSVLYEAGCGSNYCSRVEIKHLGGSVGDGFRAWKYSTLTFTFSERSGIELVPESVKLEHGDGRGIFRPSEIRSTLSRCAEVVGCYATYTLVYKDRLPNRLIETVQFTLIVNGIETPVTYTLPIEQHWETIPLAV